MFDRRRRLDEEVDAHLAEETADNIARGMNPTAARQAALRTFGNVEAAKERLRELHPLYWLDTLWQDVRFAARLIVRDRWISATIVATLTVGIAINVSAFSLLNAALLRAWVRADPETFISVIPRFAGRYGLRYSDYASMSQPDYVRLRDSARSLDSLAAYRKVSLTLSGAEAGSIRAALVSCNLSDVIRQEPPVAGRYLRPDECALGSPAAVAVLSEAAWRGRFASDPDVIGRVFHLNRVPFTVVGVAPSLGLPGLDGASEVWMPYTLLGQVRPADDYFADPRAQWLTVLGRRQPGVSLRQVEEELRLIARAADEDVPGRRTALLVTDGSLISDPEMRARAPIIFALTLGTATILLLLACVNVTTLLLSRSAARQREIAVRVSLGAGRFRLLRQLLTEGVVLSAIAAAVSLLIAWRGPAALWSAIASSPPPFDITPDWRVLLYCLVMALAAGIVAGLSPSLESLRPRLSESLKGSSGVVTAGRRRSRLRSLLVVAQIALSLVLLIQVALLTKAQRRFFSYDPGFETGAVLNVTLGSVLSGFAPPSSFYQELESRIRALPGVARTSYASLAPWSGRNPTLVLEVDGRPLLGARDYSQAPARRVVSPDYFATLNIPVTRGRALTRDDVAAAPQPVPAVISEAMARRYWPGQDPVGHRFRTSVVHEVVGVSQDVQGVTYMQDDGPFYYSPLNARVPAPGYMLVRVSGDTQAVGAAVAQIVRQLDPDMAATVVTLASIVEREGERLEPVTRYGAAAGLLALLLALSGVYAVVSFSVSQRTREIGIRTALGARRQDVLALVLRSAVTQVVWGLAAGIGLALAVSTGMESVFFGVSPRDPATVVLVSVLLSLAALGAIWIPARRAASLDPLSSLRYD